MDNINFYSNGIPAGQQTDSYTTQPGCLLSKNVDIFSSSKSIKATAFSEPVAGDSGVIASEGGLELRNDGKIYENGQVILDPSVNFPVYDVCYTGKEGTYAPAQFGTPQSMSVATDGNTWQSIQLYTDRSSYSYSKVPTILTKSVTRHPYVFYDGIDQYGYRFRKESTTQAYNSRNMQIFINIATTQYISSAKIRLRATNPIVQNLALHQFNIDNMANGFYYNNQTENMEISGTGILTLTPQEGSIFDENGIEVEFPVTPGEHTITIWIRDNTVGPDQFEYNGVINVDMNGLIVDSTAADYEDQKNHLIPNSTGDFNEYYGYLGIRDRELKEIGEYYWLKGDTYQILYKWERSWVEYQGTQVIKYEFVAEMGWDNDPAMEIVTLIEYKEQVFMVGNMNGNGYIIPCDLSGGKGTPTMFPGIQFLGGINKDYLIYLCGTDRGVSTLWAYNGQELVPVISGSQEINSKDLVDNVEQYRFDGSMVIYRNNLILGTTDNRLFRYGQTYGGRGGSFIYVLPNGAVLDKLEAKNNDLIIHYTLNQVKYTTTYQDDVPIQRFNTEYEVVYPIVIGNHILEKEDTDLYVSYLLPSANTSLEFWAMNNHYQYWTFTSEENVTLDTTKNYTMAGAGGTYALKFIERNGNQYTFELDGNLPVQTNNEMKIKDNENTVVLNYTSYNHFRLIGTLSTDKCEESKFRFTGLNNKLNLTKTHSMQIMVKGKGTTQYTPELFALNLVATQRDRG